MTPAENGDLGKVPQPENSKNEVNAAIEMPAIPLPKRKGRISRMFQSYWRNVKRRPAFMLVPPVVIFCLLCGLSILGVVLGANKYEADTRARAESAALDWAASFRLHIEKATVTPLTTLAILVQLNPQLAYLTEAFPDVARQLLASVNKDQTVVQELQLSPMGIITLIQPKNNGTDSRVGINIFKEAALRGGAINTLRKREIVINGPLKLVQGNFGTVARVPIFIPNTSLNETFGTTRTVPDDCPDNLCYNATTKEKFWGFATAIGPLDELRAGTDPRLDLLKSKGYNWLMTRPYTATELADSNLSRPEWTDRNGQYVFANSTVWPSARAAGSDIIVGNSQWRVFLEPVDGWRPNWEQGIIAAVILGNLILALLVAIIMASWAEQQRLLGDVMNSNIQLEETTAKLQEEKLRLDALLVRQYNLLAVLGGRSGGDSKSKEPGSGSDSSVGGSKEALTLERIETMRRQLAVNSNTSAQDLESIQTVELLGEGTFGKVYKGLWRGTVVAVKTMLLPANMSGAEKREKMAVMEAAISSSLSHPNIVQTYTYAIRPVREMGKHQGSNNAADSNGHQGDMTLVAGPFPSKSELVSTVHSYEVRLVLEFCDKGCLRDALDDGVFTLSPGVVNYLAVLDTAADVAKAMLHLHSLNVLHADLKARNVMLATGSTDGRGFVGKVGDFGLSLQMSHLETHISSVYQGTMTHMAPEIMLDGRVSKAADVYAFGITLFEMFTGLRAFDGVPRALLGHHITKEHLRPKFPEGTPQPFKELAEKCWQPSWELRPTFAVILEELLRMRASDPRPTPPVHVRTKGYYTTTSFTTPSCTSGNISSQTGPCISGGNSSTSPIITASLPKETAQSEAERSHYFDHSVDDTDVIVLRGWSQGISGMSGEARAMLQRAKPSFMPQIAEAEAAEREAATKSEEV